MPTKKPQRVDVIAGLNNWAEKVAMGDLIEISITIIKRYPNNHKEKSVITQEIRSINQHLSDISIDTVEYYGFDSHPLRSYSSYDNTLLYTEDIQASVPYKSDTEYGLIYFYLLRDPNDEIIMDSLWEDNEITKYLEYGKSEEV